MVRYKMISWKNAHTSWCCCNTVGPTLPEDQSVEVVTDTALIRSVNITGFNLPLTDITWFIDGVQATSGTGNITITNLDMDSPPATSTFVLDPVQFPIERGLYSVMATNDAGNDMTTFNVTVTCKLCLTCYRVCFVTISV